MEQTSLAAALEFTSSKNGVYTLEFPASIVFGIMTAGGLVMAAIHKAAADFVTHDPRMAFPTDVLSLTLQFYRPTFPSPQQTSIELEVSNLSKLATTLHVRVVQSGKPRLVGYITKVSPLTSLSFEGYVSPRQNWALTPAPRPVSIQRLESGTDPDWIGYASPYAVSGRARAHSYVNWHIPRQKEVAWRNDQWVTPAWKDLEQASGAVWTNELIHFVLDSAIPLFHDVMNETSRPDMHDTIVRAGLAQRKARAEGKSDQFRGKGLGDTEIPPWTLATLSISTEIKKLLPPDGVKWLFMRAATTGINNNRMDYDIVLLDQSGELVASSHHVVLLIAIDYKDFKL